jgi:spore coat protein CotH
VGNRMRGNTSRRNFCAENGLIYDFVHFRFSLTETFDGGDYKNGAWGSDIYKEWTDTDARATRKARTFATMEKFFYKWNKNYDNTYIREIYTNAMFREYGILAPHITLTQIQLKQAGAMHNIGVGGLYEIVDKDFIARNFDETRDGGDLYKCSWPADMVEFVNYGIETATEKFAYDLKTNDDVAKDTFNNHRYLKNFIEMLNVADDAEFRQQLSEFVDMDYFTRFEAVNFLVGNPDCIRNNKNNYYIYFTPAGKMYLIPYDYDRVLGINMDWNPTGDSMTSLDPLSTTSAVKDVPTVNPLYTRTILKGGVEEYQQLYKVKLKGVLNGEWFTYEHFKKMYDVYCANYSAVAMPSDLIVANCPAIQSHKFRFNEAGTDNLSTQFENMSTERYMELKRAYTLRFV